jgi:hypothetical protein
MSTPPHLHLVVDNSRKRRQVAVPQASIARAARVAEALGPHWYVEVDGNVYRLRQGEGPASSPVARGIGVMP